MKRVGDGLAQLLRAHQYEAETRELLSGTLARVAGIKRGRRNQQCSVVFRHYFADLRSLSGVGMIRSAASAHQRQPDGDREPEGVEEGEHAHDYVVVIDPEHLRHGLNVRKNIVVREHHAFGDARAAARKDDCRQ